MTTRIVPFLVLFFSFQYSKWSISEDVLHSYLGSPPDPTEKLDYGPGIGFGGDASGLGDVNGDGTADYAYSILREGYSKSPPYTVSAGEVRVVSGKTGETLHLIESFCKGRVQGPCYQDFGRTISWIGDVDGDGLHDLMFAATLVEKTSKEHNYRKIGAVLIYSFKGGKPNKLIEHRHDFKIEGTDDHGSDFGVSLGAISPSRVVIGTSRAISAGFGTPTFYGNARVYNIDLDLGVLIPIFEVTPPGLVHPKNLSFGASITVLSDLNGDGWNDFVVGAPNYTEGSGIYGWFRVYSGKSKYAFSNPIDGECSGDHFAAALANIGDVNQDGIEDFAVGAPMSGKGEGGDCSDPALKGTGKVHIHSGKDFQEHSSVFGGVGYGDFFHGSRFGSSIPSYPPSGLGLTAFFPKVHLNREADLIPDFLVGAPGAEVAHPSILPMGYFKLWDAGGIARVLSQPGGFAFVGSIHQGLKSRGTESLNPKTEDFFGKRLSYAGDIDGNGESEILVSSENDGGENDSEFWNEGSVVAYRVRTPLVADPSMVEFDLSESDQPIVVDFKIDMTDAHQFKNYWILGSLSSTSGSYIPLSSGHSLPLSWDEYFELTYQFPGTLIKDSIGTLDAQGKATARLELPLKYLAGFLSRAHTLYHAFYLFDDSGKPLFVSNPAAVELIY